jgi:RNA polymerase sigma-70 factor, ECF subfamily
MRISESRRTPAWHLAAAVPNPRSTAEIVSCPSYELSAIPLHGTAVIFRELIRPHERSIYLLSFAIAGNSDLAQEIALEAYYRVFKRFKHSAPIERLGTCLVETLISIGRDRAELIEDDCSRLPDLSSETLPEVFQLDPCDQATQYTLTTALQSLPQFPRVVIVLRDCLHHTTSEIAQMIGVSQTRVSETLSRARFGIYQMFLAAGLGTQPIASSC